MLNVPDHVAIIMDGNGRWAENKGMDRFQGHQQGAETARSIIKKSGNLGIKWLTLYAFSIENWARPEKEKSSLFSLMVKSLSEELPLLLKEGIRFRMIGDKKNLPENLIKIIEKAEYITRNNSDLNLSVCVNYSGKNEIIESVNKILKDFIQDRSKRMDDSRGKEKFDFLQLDDSFFKKNMHSSELPEVDLLLRTGGEKRISNFLLWDIAYSELFFTDTLWPDFSNDEFCRILDEFNLRERRYGNV
tara:strand:- start:2786 stop:3523 length:738 start_codon:yes stop_codon:yes gene_type:complete